MNLAELKAALDGLFAYDTGCVGSGIKDESLRAHATQALNKLNRQELAVMVREMWLSDEAISAGYGAEDVAEFFRWLTDRMNFDLAR